MDKIREAIQALLGLKELPSEEELKGFSPEQLEEAIAKARVSFDQAKESKDFDAASVAHDVIVAIKAETERRETEAADLEAKFAEMEAAIAEADEDEEETEEPVEEEEEVEEETKSEVEEEEAPKAEEEPEVEAPEAPAVEKVAASARKPVPKPKGKPGPAKPLTRILAAGDIDGHSAGTAISVQDMADAWVNKAEAIRTSGLINKPVGVATIKGEEASSRTLDPGNPAEKNSAIIMPVVEEARAETRKTLQRMLATRDEFEMEALMAAGGFCAPLEPRYDIFAIGDDDRPLANSLPGFNARRGGIRYIDADTVPYMVDTDDALGHFTEDQDTSGDDYPKPCLRIDCPTWEEVFVEADTLCMIVGAWQRLTFPENFRAWWRAAQVNKARQSETRLWDKMVALTTAVSAGEGLGATPDVLAQVTRAAAQMRWRYRINRNTSLRFWAPSFLSDIMKTDLARRQPGDGLDVMAVSDAQLARFFAARNIAVTFVSDGQSPGGTSGDIQAAGALNPWPTSVETILAVEGTFLFLEMNGLNFGTEIRDFDMIRNNDVGAFLETFENVARVGTQALSLTLNICPDGTTAGVDADFDPCVAGS